MVYLQIYIYVPQTIVKLCIKHFVSRLTIALQGTLLTCAYVFRFIADQVKEHFTEKNQKNHDDYKK